VKGYKTWIAGQLEPAGRLTVDAGAVGALLSGKSLLPAGVKLVSGNFRAATRWRSCRPRAARSRAGWLPTTLRMP
jgi:glutamate 5-kinase